MLAIFMTTFREGLEALLIISVAMAFLRQSGQPALLRPLLAGAGIAALGSAGLGVYLARVGALSPLWEGWLALTAVALILACVIHMARHGKQLAREIRERLAVLSQGQALAVWWGVFLFAVLMVGREGVEAATLIAALSTTESGLNLAASGGAGLLTAGLLAGLWGRYGPRVNVGLLFRVTGLFLSLFAIQLVVYAFHEFSEANALPLLDNAYWHTVTEPYGPDGEVGVWLTYLLLLVPLAVLLWAWLARQWRGSVPST